VVEVTDIEKQSSLLQCGFNCSRKWLYSTGPHW
jgi:hypothetical protein